MNYQSPVFHLDNEDFAFRFNRLLNNVTENLSLFSTVISDNWEETRLLNPEAVKNEYLSLERINEQVCEAIEEPVKDPYLRILLAIRHEHRQLNMPLSKKWSEVWFNISSVRYRLSRAFNKFKN